MDQREFVREHQAEAVGIARRLSAVEKPYVVHYLSCRAQPAQAKPESARFVTLDQAEAFAQTIVHEWGTAAASIWEERCLSIWANSSIRPQVSLPGGGDHQCLIRP